MQNLCKFLNWLRYNNKGSNPFLHTKYITQIMGRYSRKDMIEFSNFAKSYQSSRKVSEAYDAYLKGKRIVTKNNKK